MASSNKKGLGLLVLIGILVIMIKPIMEMFRSRPLYNGGQYPPGTYPNTGGNLGWLGGVLAGLGSAIGSVSDAFGWGSGGSGGSGSGGGYQPNEDDYMGWN